MSKKIPEDFEIGSKIVYPSHGIGTIDKIDKKPKSGLNEACYIIRFTNGMTIMAPVRSAVSVGLRNVISKRDVSKVMKILRDDVNGVIETNWNKRQKSYQEKMKSGSIFEVATVYRDLSFLRDSKGLSFGEQQVFDNARKLIVSEIAEAKGVEEDTVVKMINTALSN